MTPEAHVTQLIQQGQFKKALAALKKLLKGTNRFWALKQSGMIYHELGRMPEAVTALKKALSIDAGDLDANLFLGSASHALAKYDQAIPCLEKVLQQQPRHYYALRLMALICIERKQWGEALNYARLLVSEWPEKAESQLLYGQAVLESGDVKEGIDAFDRVIKLLPERYEGYYALAGALAGSGRIDEAVGHYQTACKLAADPVPPVLDLAQLYQQTGRHSQATELYESLYRQNPANTRVLNSLAFIYIKLYKIGEAIQLLEASLKLEPDNPQSHIILSSAYKAIGNLDKYIECSKKAIALMDPDPTLFSTYLLNTNYLPRFTNKELYEEHRKWDAQFAPAAQIYDHASHDYSTGRKIRIAYISADLKNHAMYYFIEPLFAHHDKSEFEVYCYYNDLHKDDITRRFEGYADQWRDIFNLSDAKVGELIFKDKIDILIDLSGHTGGNRLPVIARKPAPLQIEYECYPNTTGLSAIDYKLTDRLLDSADDQQWHSEKLHSLGECFICYQPNELAPEPGEPPRARNDYITFGSFSNLYKLNEDVVRVWSRILHKAPTSKLMLVRLSINEHAIKYFAGLFRKNGIDEDRIIFIGETPAKYAALPAGTSHMAIMSDCDVILDTFPYNNHTIACEALWLGVPLVTLYGSRHASRVCASILNAIGHDELIAYSEDEYIDKAIALGNDKQRLLDLRAGMREQFRKSMLMDFPGFTGKLESAYKQLWADLCNRMEQRT